MAAALMYCGKRYINQSRERYKQKRSKNVQSTRQTKKSKRHCVKGHTNTTTANKVEKMTTINCAKEFYANI